MSYKIKELFYRLFWGSGKNQRDNKVAESKLMSLDSIASLQM